VPSITCPICSRTSHHPEDVAQGYCGACHAFTRECASGGPRCRSTPTTIFGNIAFCAAHAEEIAPAQQKMRSDDVIVAVCVASAVLAIALFIWMLTW
jgi:hypothetical protein